MELPILAGILKIIHWVGRDGMLTVVAWLMAFMQVRGAHQTARRRADTSFLPVGPNNSFSFQLVMIPLYPYLIAPLFNKFTALPEESPVFPKVKALSEKLGFPLGPSASIALSYLTLSMLTYASRRTCLGDGREQAVRSRDHAVGA